MKIWILLAFGCFVASINCKSYIFNIERFQDNVRIYRVAFVLTVSLIFLILEFEIENNVHKLSGICIKKLNQQSL